MPLWYIVCWLWRIPDIVYGKTQVCFHPNRRINVKAESEITQNYHNVILKNYSKLALNLVAVAISGRLTIQEGIPTYINE